MSLIATHDHRLYVAVLIAWWFTSSSQGQEHVHSPVDSMSEHASEGALDALDHALDLAVARRVSD